LPSITFIFFIFKFKHRWVLKLHILILFFLIPNVLSPHVSLFYSTTKNFFLPFASTSSPLWHYIHVFSVDGSSYLHSLISPFSFSLQASHFIFLIPLTILPLFSFFTSAQFFYSTISLTFESFNFISFVETSYLITTACVFFINFLSNAWFLKFTKINFVF
jgi:hypothetical protein